MRRSWIEPRASRGLGGCALALAALACAPATSIEAPLVPERTRLHEGAVSALVPLADGRALIDDAAGLWIVGEPGTEPTRVGEPGELGAITAWTALDGATLVAGEDAVVLVRGGSIGAAPLATALEGAAIRALAATPRAGAGDDLWIATSEGLHLFRDGALAPIEIDGHDLAGAAIAPAGEEELWVVADARLLRVALDDEGALRVSSFDRPTDVTALASDDRGVPWMVADGALHALEAGVLLRFELGTEVAAVRASGVGPDVWIEAEGATFHAARRAARPVEALATTTALPGIDGEALVVSGGGVDRLRARHRVALEGVHAGAQLVDVTPVAIVTSAPGATLEASIDRMPIELDGSSLTLDPSALTIGEHTLEIVARWTDGTLPVLASTRFFVAPTVTWTDHIQPLYAEQCADCHGPAGPSPTRLDSLASWQANIERILDNTRAGRMPLGRPALDPERVEWIETWARTGFPE